MSTPTPSAMSPMTTLEQRAQANREMNRKAKRDAATRKTKKEAQYCTWFRKLPWKSRDALYKAWGQAQEKQRADKATKQAQERGVG